jgi:hypothetical protein
MRFELRRTWASVGLAMALTAAHGQPADVLADGPPWGGPGRMRSELKLVDQFDRNDDGRMDAAERKEARAFAKEERTRTPRRGPRRPPGDDDVPPEPGPKVAVADAPKFPNASLYASNVVRTFFLEFESPDWESELSDFHQTDVEVPAKLTVDGRTYDQVGVSFRGASSFMMVSPGRKRSLNLSLDYARKGQNLLGARTLNLLNGHEDPSLLRTVLYSHIAQAFIPTPRANFVRVVINGEYWGVFVNAEQFNKDFTETFFNSEQGARWKVPGSPQGGGSLAYLGEDAAAYRRAYEIKSKDNAKSWDALIRLCRTLNQTPSNELVKALSPMLDIDGALKFLALENVLINNDGYWVRTSDYNLYLDPKGRFHLVPHDMNETFTKPGGPGMGGRRRLNRGDGTNNVPPADEPLRQAGWPAIPLEGVGLTPLFGLGDTNKPLISRLLAVPELRTRYLGYVRELAETWLDWKNLGPVASNYHALIARDVQRETRGLDSFERFEKNLTEDVAGRGFGPGGGTKLGIKSFADQRRAYLLKVLREGEK